MQLVAIQLIIDLFQFGKVSAWPPQLFHSIWNNIVSNLPYWDILFVKMSEQVVVPLYGKLSFLTIKMRCKILQKTKIKGGRIPQVCLNGDKTKRTRKRRLQKVDWNLTRSLAESLPCCTPIPTSRSHTNLLMLSLTKFQWHVTLSWALSWCAYWSKPMMLFN